MMGNRSNEHLKGISNDRHYIGEFEARVCVCDYSQFREISHETNSIDADSEYNESTFVNCYCN